VIDRHVAAARQGHNDLVASDFDSKGFPTHAP
jgi:hypothetical protein